MPIIDIILLSLFVFAFLALAMVLAWGDYQTRDIARASRERALTADRVAIKQNVRAEHVAPVASESSKASVEA